MMCDVFLPPIASPPPPIRPENMAIKKPLPSENCCTT